MTDFFTPTWGGLKWRSFTPNVLLGGLAITSGRVLRLTPVRRAGRLAYSLAKMLLSQLVIYLPPGKGMSEFHQLSGLVGHVIGYQMRAVSFRSRQTAYPVLDQHFSPSQGKMLFTTFLKHFYYRTIYIHT